jgi:hypothetical protein
MHRSKLLAGAALAALLGIAAGCSDNAPQPFPKMEIDPAKLAVSIDDAPMDVTDQYAYRLTVLNTGNADLQVLEPLFEQKCGLYELAWEGNPSYPFALAPTKDKSEGFDLTVTYTKSDAACADKKATLTIRSSNDMLTPQIQVVFDVVSTPPSITAEDVDFGFVAEGTAGEQTLFVGNQGSGTLLVDRVRFLGSTGFSFQWDCERAAGSKDKKDDWIPITEKMGAIGGADCTTCDVKCDSPIAVSGGLGHEVHMRYGAVCDPDPAKKCPPEAEAKITLVSNDPAFKGSEGEGKVVTVTANKGGRCIQALNSPVDFGSIVAPNLVQKDLVLRGCGDKDVEIATLSIVDANPAPTPFSFAMPAGKTLPYTLKPNENLAVAIKYQPATTHKDATGAYQQDTAKLQIDNDSPVAALKVPLMGLPVDAQCAVADFKATVNGALVKDGDEIAIQSTIKLKQDCYDLTPGGAIVSYEWDVKTSTPATESIQPNALAPDVTYDANVVGTYDITLECTNKFGCSQAKTIHLNVKAPEGCHVELTWNTPLDPDQTDQCGTSMDCGSDMDLHVVHPAASGPDIDKDGNPDGFFDVGQYGGAFAGDCMWFNPNPTWDKMNASDPNYQPHLDRDDTDGAGPENFSYKFPEQDKCYKIGVHYWDDHNLGKSYPTIRVWVDADKIWENSVIPKMSALDLWEVGEICCTSKTFNEYKKVDGSQVIIHNYVNPDFNFTP